MCSIGLVENYYNGYGRLGDRSLRCFGALDMKLSIDGKVPEKFWYIVGIALLAIAGASHETIVEVVV